MKNNLIERIEALTTSKISSEDIYTRELLYSLRRAVCILEYVDEGQDKVIFELSKIIF